MSKSIILLLLVIAGSILIIFNVAMYFLNSFEYTLTHDGTNPDNILQNKIGYVYLGFGFILLGIILKYFIIIKK